MAHPLICTIENLKEAYPDTDVETLYRYIDLRKEGYPTHQAIIMSGLGDPDE